jgi:hypothetical protein
MGEGIIAEKTPIKVTRIRGEKSKLNKSVRIDNANPPIAMNHT